MAGAFMEKLEQRHEGGITVSLELKSNNGDLTTVSVAGPSYVHIAKALDHVGDGTFIKNLLIQAIDGDDEPDDEEEA